ncbi:unnamed protein product [Angiostrongylus costaricensis]|uniref:C2 domain-containing protein n=1 Tax=Angiostrongylus costaricensis TaxID=334426 RepID=A0A158PMH2_ANGCS|nr:unnamed protein product [Angiostrongylus costaricensis]
MHDSITMFFINDENKRSNRKNTHSSVVFREPVELPIWETNFKRLTYQNDNVELIINEKGELCRDLVDGPGDRIDDRLHTDHHHYVLLLFDEN